MKQEKQTQRPVKPAELFFVSAKWRYFTKYGEIFKLRNNSQSTKELKNHPQITQIKRLSLELSPLCFESTEFVDTNAKGEVQTTKDKAQAFNLRNLCSLWMAEFVSGLNSQRRGRAMQPRS